MYQKELSDFFIKHLIDIKRLHFTFQFACTKYKNCLRDEAKKFKMKKKSDKMFLFNNSKKRCSIMVH